MPIGCAKNRECHRCCYCHSNVQTRLWEVAVVGHRAERLHAHALTVNSLLKDRTHCACRLSAGLYFTVALKDTRGMLC